MVPRFGLQVRSAFSGLVGKRLGDVWVGFGCLSGLPLAARTNSAERVEAMEALVPRFATGVLDGEIGAHLTRAAVEARQHQCRHAGLHMQGSMHVDRLGEGVQGKTLPGRLGLPP